jgi:hypothetical protein
MNSVRAASNQRARLKNEWGVKESNMKRMLVCAALAMGIAMAVPGSASAWHGGWGWHGGGWHGGGWGGGWHGGGWGWRPRVYGFYPGYYGAYAGYGGYGGCWRWVQWPYWHRVNVCY